MTTSNQDMDCASDRRFSSLYWNTAAILCLLWLSLILLNGLKTVARWIWAFLLAPHGIFNTDIQKYGRWAVVTGASEGIGRGYALEALFHAVLQCRSAERDELARLGLNVVIMSRSKEKLQKVADEIETLYNREVLTVSVDFLQGQKVYSNIAEQIKDLDIGILVNNVGYFDYPSDFECLQVDSLRNTVELNCQTVIQMTKLLLPQMVEKRKGIVINVSSLSGDFARNVYSASKCFVNNFSEGLRHEYTNKGIIVQTVAPCIVATRLSGFKDSQVNFFIVDAVHYARAAVATIGILKFTYGCLSHELQGYVLTRLPSLTVNAIFKLMNTDDSSSEKKSK